MSVVTVRVLIRRLAHGAGLPLPSYQTEGAVAMDVAAAVNDEIFLAPGAIVAIPSGFELAIPNGYEGQLRPRSGLATKYGITLPNSPATIDADYRGEVLVPLINLGQTPFVVKRGERIAQLLILAVPKTILEEVSDLPTTPRNRGGFGHTGR